MKHCQYILILLSAMVYACSSSTGDPSEPENEADTYEFSLQGTWKLNCQSEAGEALQSRSIELTFSPPRTDQDAAALSVDRKIYETADCAGTSRNDLSSVRSATYEIGETVLTEGGLMATELDLALLSETFYDGTEVEYPGNLIQDIAHIDTNTLYFGILTENGDRPEAIDFDRPFYRVEN